MMMMKMMMIMMISVRSKSLKHKTVEFLLSVFHCELISVCRYFFFFYVYYSITILFTILISILKEVKVAHPYLHHHIFLF